MIKDDYKRILISLIFGGALGLTCVLIIRKFSGVTASIDYVSAIVTILVVSNRKYIFK